MGWEQMVYGVGIGLLVFCVTVAMIVGPAFMPMIFPDAEATTTITAYYDPQNNPVNPLHFRNDQYGNVHITSADFFVPRFLHCVAPASGYDAYIASGIIMGSGRMYYSPTWYSTDVSSWPHKFTGADRIDPGNLLHGGQIVAVVDPAGGGQGTGYYRPGVYYYPDSTTEFDHTKFRDASSAIDRSGQANAEVLLMIDLDEDLLRERGYLIITYPWVTNPPQQVYPSADPSYFLYSTLPGGPGSWQTFEYEPSLLWKTGEPAVNTTMKTGNIAMGYNIDMNAKHLSLIGRGSEGDYFREVADGSFTALHTWAPGHYQPIEPYWYPGVTTSPINVLTIPYYKLYDDPDNDSTSYTLTCQIVNPWGTEDLFSHRHTYTPRTTPVLSTYAQSWFTGNFTPPVQEPGGLNIAGIHGNTTVLPEPVAHTPVVAPPQLPIGSVTNQTLHLSTSVLPNITRVDPPPIGGYYTSNNYLDLVTQVEPGSRTSPVSPIRTSCEVTSKTHLVPLYPIRNVGNINSDAPTTGMYHQLYGRVNMSHPGYDADTSTCVDGEGTISRTCARQPGLILPPSPDESFVYSCQYNGTVHAGTVLAEEPIYVNMLNSLTTQDRFGWGSPQFLGLGIIGFMGLLSCMVGFNRKNLAASAVTFTIGIGLMGYVGILNVTESIMAAVVVVTILAVFQRGAKT